MIELISKNEKDTDNIARQIAKIIKPGDIIALHGTLGVGKTAFTRFLIQSFLGEEEVPSPTFTLLQTYDTPRGAIYHFDLYRIKKPDEVYELGIEDAFAEGISLIEWPEKMGSILPKKKTLHIHITLDGDARIFSFDTENADWTERLKNIM